jgi:phosphate transport system permease protein
MVFALLALLAFNGMGHFWQKDLVELRMRDGSVLLGEVQGEDSVRGGEITEAEPRKRTLLKVGNRDFTGIDFKWVFNDEIESLSRPEDSTLLERMEWGNFYGAMTSIRRGEETLASGSMDVWRLFDLLHPRKREEFERIRALETGKIGNVNHRIEALRLRRSRIEGSELPAGKKKERLFAIDAETTQEEASYARLADELFAMREAFEAEVVTLRSETGETKEIPLGSIVRAVRPNRMGAGAKMALYLSRAAGFVWEEPRESNTEGGVFPAIFGTVMMVFMMSVAAVPLGVLAALYLREYSRQGMLVRSVRIAVNNLAGVPSIVFGVFGLGFFVYMIGGSIDRLFYSELLPTPTFGTGGILWASLTLALLTVPVVIVATEEGLAAVPRVMREGSMALGATKFETTTRIVLPAAAPGILTGMILAMARAAGEVAPLMIVGIVKLAPSLPLDHHFPFVHFERKFMHLGFHIYDLGFQSPNVEATKPLVYATALLLVLLVTGMNLVAIYVRNRLRKRYAGSGF